MFNDNDDTWSREEYADEQKSTKIHISCTKVSQASGLISSQSYSNETRVLNDFELSILLKEKRLKDKIICNLEK